MSRSNGRNGDELRPMKLTAGVNKYAEGSVFIEVGETKVICTATVEERVPLYEGTRKRLGNRRVFHASACDS